MSSTTVEFDRETIKDLEIRLEILTGMEPRTRSRIASRALSLLKQDLADRLKDAGKWEEYQDAVSESSLNSSTGDK